MKYPALAAIVAAVLLAGCGGSESETEPAPPPAAVAVGLPPIFDPDLDLQYNSDGIDVTWVSLNEEEGFVEWAYGPNGADDLRSKRGTYSRAADWRTSNPDRPIPYERLANKRTHRVRLIGATPGSTIHYDIVSGGYSSGPHRATIPSAVFTSPDNFMIGKVISADGEPGVECLVSFMVSAMLFSPLDGSELGVGHSSWVNTMTDGTTEPCSLPHRRSARVQRTVSAQRLGSPAGPAR